MIPTLEDAYRQYFPMIQAKCARMLGNGEDARDVAQETFVRFWQARDALRVPEAAVGWVYRTATHLAIDRVRARKVTTDLEALSASDANPEEESHARRTLLALSKVLSKNEMEVALLLRGDGMSQAEVAEVMGISERTVRRIVNQLDASLARFAAAQETCP